MLSQDPKIMAIQHWFLVLSLARRDFFWFPESLNNIMYCRQWNPQILCSFTLCYFQLHMGLQCFADHHILLFLFTFRTACQHYWKRAGLYMQLKNLSFWNNATENGDVFHWSVNIDYMTKNKKIIFIRKHKSLYMSHRLGLCVSSSDEKLLSANPITPSCQEIGA